MRLSACLRLSLVVALLACPVYCQDDEDRVPVVRQENNPPAAREGGFHWITALGFAFLTFNSGMAIYRSNKNLADIAFVVSSYFDLVALFACLRLYERAAPGSRQRDRLKMAVWGLTTFLTVMFSSKVAAIMPLMVKLLVWAMAAATSAGGFYAFFLHKDAHPELD